MLNVFMLSVFKLNVVMLSVVMLNVVAPGGRIPTLSKLGLISTISISRRYAECRYAEYRAARPEQCPTLEVYYYFSLLS